MEITTEAEYNLVAGRVEERWLSNDVLGLKFAWEEHCDIFLELFFDYYKRCEMCSYITAYLHAVQSNSGDGTIQVCTCCFKSYFPNSQ